MPAILANAPDFLLTSDYPLDKVVARFTGSLALSGYFDSELVNIPHSLSFTPLPVVQWSLTSDFSTTYEAGSGPLPDDVTRFYFGIQLDTRANSTNVIIEAANFLTAGQTIYYRVFCFMPSDVNSDVTFTADTGDEFALNTDYNYTKLFASGKLTLASNATYTHNLGYVPQVFGWLENGGTIYTPFTNMNVSKPTSTYTPAVLAGIKVTSTTIEFIGLSSYTYGHFRVYIDS